MLLLKAQEAQLIPTSPMKLDASGLEASPGILVLWYRVVNEMGMMGHGKQLAVPRCVIYLSSYDDFTPSNTMARTLIELVEDL